MSVRQKSADLGIRRLLGIHYYVRDLERSRHFYVDLMDFLQVGESSPELMNAGKQRSLAFAAGDAIVVCSTPVGEGGRAHRYLKKHPDGIGTIAFEVEDIERAFSLLDARGGTPIEEIQRHQDEYGTSASFSITTPFGDTTFRFFERKDYVGLFPGMLRYDSPRGGKNRFNFLGFDHITANFQTMKPALLWLEHVLGFEPFWHVEFHTEEVAHTTNHHGSGLRSQVMWDPISKIKFANNEPYRPFFKNSQINLFNEQHRGDGVQHVALATPDVLAAVSGLRARGVSFMKTPKSYYEMLPGRLKQLGVGAIDEDLAKLEELEVLVDGAGKGKYLLQIFLQDSAELYHSPEAGPFFFELIQRKGDPGFGAGNFRALFESIERQQLESMDEVC
jgi:4-hydroxyphenylpyruvate dioxygenase